MSLGPPVAHPTEAVGAQPNTEGNRGSRSILPCNTLIEGDLPETFYHQCEKYGKVHSYTPADLEPYSTDPPRLDALREWWSAIPHTTRQSRQTDVAVERSPPFHSSTRSAETDAGMIERMRLLKVVAILVIGPALGFVFGLIVCGLSSQWMGRRPMPNSESPARKLLTATPPSTQLHSARPAP
jgi:hypothetical protein